MLFSADNAPKNALCAEQADNRVNTRPSRTKAKYGVTGGICALFSLCRNNRLNIAGLHVFTLPLGRMRASQTAGRRQSRPLPLLLGGQKPCTHF